ncbi:MAG: hypothetical protein AMK71_10315 [Nitrospira bacterium SG8_35_4]|nr:MAG: hypothetical protein AMK71_10315 [Nitrospira bacterium SG8_35_4]
MALKRKKGRPAYHQGGLQRPLDGVAIELTTSCNLSCKMCSVWKRKEPEISYDKILSLLGEARALGAEQYYSCGTEPFAREDTPDILAYAERIGFRESCIVSNGLLLHTSDIMDRVEKLGIVHIVISLDGPEEVHDELRGKGTYSSAVAALRELRKREITCSIASIIMRQTVDRLKEIIDLAAGLGIPVISMQPYQPETAGLDSDHAAFTFRPEEEENLRMKLKELMDYAQKTGVTIYTANMMKFIPPYLARGIRHVPPCGCHVPSRLLVVDSSGDTFPCFMMRERLRNKSMGNIYETSLNNIWHNSIHGELVRTALDRRCPGCLASCSDVESYDELQRRGWFARYFRKLTRQ